MKNNLWIWQKGVRKKARLQASRKWMQEVLHIYLGGGGRNKTRNTGNKIVAQRGMGVKEVFFKIKDL